MTLINLTRKRQGSGTVSSLRKRFLSLIALFVALPVFAQNIDVTGTVFDKSGEPLIGVTVMVEGSANGAATDIDGNYSLRMVPSKGKLVFSYIGYNTVEVEVKGRTKIDVTMDENSKALDELVVVGYGQIKKSDLTGSVSTIDAQAINAKGSASVLESLQGSVPGVNITKQTGRTNGNISIEIRGKSSINSNVTPLYVVDGVETNDISFLNPQDIERVDILKDASSTAIYGSRATAGVVMVTTKSGAGAHKGAQATISYDGYYGISHATRMPQF
ncbi:MAG: TonB-dependent receptor plug domain-containing protein, partial [Muribaculaceae bacterium]|nr:TonB-dependent receptor plug domain-containing protein [Muribaculaceae bacterium]